MFPCLPHLRVPQSWSPVMKGIRVHTWRVAPRVLKDSSVPDSQRNPQGRSPCLHGCSWGWCSPYTTNRAHNSHSDLHLYGKGSKNWCCLCVNCDYLNGDHEFGGLLNGGRPPGGYSRGTGQRWLGGGLPLTVVKHHFTILLQELCI